MFWKKESGKLLSRGMAKRITASFDIYISVKKNSAFILTAVFDSSFYC